MSSDAKTGKNKPVSGIKTDRDGAPIIREGVTVFFMSEVLDAPVVLKSGMAVGKLKDIAIRINGGAYPEATHIVVSRKWGKPDLLFPWNNVSEITERQAVVDVSENIENFVPSLGWFEELVLVNEKIMDKKIIDMEDREVEVV
ncbi:MAG: hypothetical protein WCX65_02115, partial [bacterium]